MRLIARSWGIARDCLFLFSTNCIHTEADKALMLQCWFVACESGSFRPGRVSNASGHRLPWRAKAQKKIERRRLRRSPRLSSAQMLRETRSYVKLSNVQQTRGVRQKP